MLHQYHMGVNLLHAMVQGNSFSKNCLKDTVKSFSESIFIG